jgi:3-hydroxybutyryl-CoA dehydrogenase
MTEIRTIGIIGAGQMGGGIAQVCALAGYAIVLMDSSESALSKAKELLASRLEALTAKGRLEPDAASAALARITPVTQMSGLAACDLVIEAASENESVKRQIYAELCPVLGPDTLIGTNTSSISITRLAAATDRPDKFMGIHFMNPVPVMKLIEIVRGIATSEDTYLASKAFAESLGKTVTLSEDFPAFIVNRILLPMINEAIYTLYEGVGSVDAIDTAMRLGANHPMGPLQLADFIGLDTCLSIMQVLHDGLSDSKYRPCPLLVKYVEAGWLGRKTGRGFYDYRGETPVPTR